MLIAMIARHRLHRAVAGLPDRLQRDVGLAPERLRQHYLPDLSATESEEARLRRLVGVCLLRR